MQCETLNNDYSQFFSEKETNQATYKNQLLRIDEVRDLTTVGKSTINLWVAQGKFPKPFYLSPTIKVWRLDDINSWIDSALKGELHE
jgi:prophage regulatory protein